MAQNFNLQTFPVQSLGWNLSFRIQYVLICEINDKTTLKTNVFLENMHRASCVIPMFVYC